MPAEWDLRIVISIFKGNGDIRNCSCHRAVNLFDHGIKLMERVLEKRHHRIVSVDEMQFGFMPERGTIDAVFMLRRMQEKYHAKGKKLYMCFEDLEKAFDIVPRNVLKWALRKNKISEVMVRSVMSQYKGAKTKVRVDFELT